MQINTLVLLIVFGIFLCVYVNQATSRETSSNEETTGGVEERIMSAFETLQQQVGSLISSIERMERSLYKVQDMVEETNSVQQNLVDYLGLKDETTTERKLTTEPLNTGCGSDQFMCDNGYCISGVYKCNGEFDCRDLSDENEQTCPRHQRREIYLTKDNSNITIRHPANEGEYHSNEQFHWIVLNEVAEALGFRIDVLFVSLQKCCDRLKILRDDCSEDTRIVSRFQEPIFYPNRILNIQFTSDESVNYNGFILQISVVYTMNDPGCSQYKKEIVLHQDETTIQIRHPKIGGDFVEDEQYVWMIRNENTGAVGFEITFEEVDMERCCENMRIEGQYCSYGKYTFVSTPTLTVRGDHVNVTWTSDPLNIYAGFVISVSSVQELGKTECHEYTCDDAQRCVRVHYDDWLSWNDSAAACEAEGARLVVITDEGLNQLVLSLLIPPYSFPWIGISENSSDEMVWITGSSPHDYNYQNWMDGLTRLSEERQCGYIRAEGWRFVECSYKNGYVCEKL